jgi:hypothetical protein
MPMLISTHLTLRLQQGDSIDLTPDYSRLLKMANDWDFRMRSRSRWITDQETRREMGKLAREDLEAIGVHEGDLLRLATALVVEVCHEVRVDSEATPSVIGGLASGSAKIGWRRWIGPVLERKLRKIPWETLLNEAAQKYRAGRRLVVYRRIKAETEYQVPEGPLKALFVQSAPGPLAPVVDFSQEFKAVKCYLRGIDWGEPLVNPTLAQMKERIRDEQPVVIHISGYDAFQGSQLLEDLEAKDEAEEAEPAPAQVRPLVPDVQIASDATKPEKVEATREGVYFRNDTGQAVVIAPEALAEAMCGAEHKPLLVTYNIYNSSARMAAKTVDSGAMAAIGFQDFVDDTIAEVFFASLFRQWSAGRNVSLLGAFRDAIVEIVSEPETTTLGRKSRGSGINLWCRVPLLLENKRLAFPGQLPPRRKGKHTERPNLEFEIAPYRQLNYSVLHNGRKQIFELFRVYKFSPEDVDDIRVDVTLSVGGDEFHFETTRRMTHHILDLSEEVRVGLTSTLSRSLRESVRTTVFVRVAQRDDERYRSTFGISLLAVDEWIDDDDLGGSFLPSFVLPRDPIVPKVLGQAQGYLMAIADDVAQGFDGYQSVEAFPEDPAGALEPQVRAIWYALQHDYALRYINPPPTFSESSQRLRTPNEVLTDGRGTCIDLALLIAACLELIGLHPVLFLLTGHAFVGYWTDEGKREDFVLSKSVELSASTTALSHAADAASSEAGEGSPNAEGWELDAHQEGGWEIAAPPVEWKFTNVRWPGIVDALASGHLVAIEATYLTNGGSFSEACATGAENLSDATEFDSMMDVTLAREYDVTPLPMTNGG